MLILTQVFSNKKVALNILVLHRNPPKKLIHYTNLIAFLLFM